MVTAAYPELYRARPGRVELVDVPELGFVVAAGVGSPESEDFSAAVGSLYAVAYTAHFMAKDRYGAAPRVMPLEALWWVDGDAGAWSTVPREQWHWQAMINQPDPIDADLVAEAVDQARRRSGALGSVEYVRWREGLAAQVLHVGPFETEPVTIELLHREIARAGRVPRGRHHEIYFGDPRRTAPERLRTLLRQPVA